VASSGFVHPRQETDVPLPTDGFDTSRITYSLETSDNLPVQIVLTTNNGDRRVAAEQFLPYLDAALNSLRTEYENGTSESVLYIERSYDGNARDTV
jgi:hypothetical protein